MKLQHIDITQLKVSPINVRNYGGNDVSDLVTSIRANGVLQNLLVRKNGKGFEVVAGKRRLKACQQLAKENKSFSQLPCALLDDDDDAKAIEASLAENIERLPMDEIDQFKAFSALISRGRSASDIASHFGVTERLVNQRLALANLYRPILAAYRNRELEPDTMRILTMATKAQQKDWIKLLRDKDSHPPIGRRLRAWLFGGSDIAITAALFPLPEYDGSITSDLFGEDQYFADIEKFWTLQNEAIAAKKDAYLEAGWPEVIVIDIGHPWISWEMSARPKTNGGKIYILPSDNGKVTFYEGYVTNREATKLDRAKSQANGKGDTVSEQKPELTQTAQLYLDLHRHNAVRNELLKHPAIALRLMIAHTIAGSNLWSVTPEKQSSGGNAAISESVDNSKAQQAFATERAAIFKLLGLKATRDFVIEPHGYGEDLPVIFSRLLALKDKDVMRILSFTMAETLSSGTPVIEALGTILKVDMVKWWKPEATFFTLMRDKNTINAMLSDIAGKRVADGNVSATSTVQKKIISDCLEGKEGRTKVTGWMPPYMSFPMKAYRRAATLSAVQNWKAVSKHFKTV